VVAVANAQHLGPIGVVAPALAPEVGRLKRRHQHFLGASAVLLLTNDLLDLLQDSKAERQPGIDAGRGLAHETGAQHQLVADDLGVSWAFFEDWQKRLGPPHGGALYGERLKLATAALPDWAVTGSPQGLLIMCRKCRLHGDSEIRPSYPAAVRTMALGSSSGRG